ncbi:hypothetical protein D3227_35270 [Mesorhizobium waimense]|uniref:Transglycosylase SLT domain-containing protein n=1 Tax=Mesorhizobium waimense TaxID=1300307 RepID=A0A3A5K6L1_9HYPH|nr:lytic transglycosylase domain-containing protein [Mesorhizobium waimense]RJT27874.1 hypothetical protein D3227_35270 [Mesorhizobium waimense]
MIARQATAARNEGQGRPDACQSLRMLIAPQFVAGKSDRRSLALERSEHGGKVMAHRDGGVCAALHRGTAVLSACVILILSVSAICAESNAYGRRQHPAAAPLRLLIPGRCTSGMPPKASRFPNNCFAVMQVESVGDVHAVSSRGAMGLMQIMPAT